MDRCAFSASLQGKHLGTNCVRVPTYSIVRLEVAVKGNVTGTLNSVCNPFLDCTELIGHSVAAANCLLRALV